jgi:Cu+-exporting ATPase
MEKDPVCGMLVNPSRAVGQRTAGGKTYYFCSASCLAKFDAKPERYVLHAAKEKT